MKIANKPDVKDYLSATQYLKDIQAYKKSTSRSFSYEKWARELKMPSRSYLRLVVTGKRKISEMILEKLSAWLALNEEDKEYFVFLVRYTQSTSHAEKKLASQKMMALIRRSVHIADQTPDSHFLSSPICLQIRDLISLTDIQRTPENLSQILNLPVQKVTECLQSLAKVGMAEQGEFDQWHASKGTIKVSDDPKNEVLNEFHKKSLLNAIEKIKMDPDKRKYRGLNLALSDEDYQKLHEHVSKFLTNTFAEFSTESGKGKTLYQLNYNLIPLTNKMKD